MRHSFLSSLLLLADPAMLSLAQNVSKPPGVENINNDEMTKRVIHYWADFQCTGLSDHSEQNIKEQCKKACLEFESAPPVSQYVAHSQTCVYDSSMESWYRTGKPLTEEERKKPLPRECK
jgi:hypothetical protein